MPPPDHTAFLSMPGYGDLTAGAARGFWRASALPDDRLYRQYNEGSLLAANFNALWATALNLAHKGRRVDYFAMQHSDVEPEDGWLDTLIAELEARDLDVLGVAVPIKDAHGLTSLALARDDGDTWRIHARLTTTEIRRLPATFTSADVGRPLLLNTGLWACRFDPAWAKQVRFTINDRIVFDKGADAYRAECEPEDWYFSRLLHELGLKVGATRKIRLTHRGPAAVSNQAAWGSPHDAAYVDASPLPDRPDGGFCLPDINGWLAADEGQALADLARGKRVLEVGSYEGLSTVTMARTAEHVVSVDPHDGRGTAVPADTLAPLLRNLGRYGVTDKVRVAPGTLAEYAPIWSDLRFDLAFIDGDHARAAVEADIAHARPLLAPGGLLAFHDYRSPADPGVAEAVDGLLARGGELLSLVGSLAVVRPPAVVLAPRLAPLEA